MKKVLIAGGSGLIGSRLSQLLSDSGYEVRWLSRSEQNNVPYPTFQWNVKDGTMDEMALDGVSYVINLAGAGIADKPWTTERKKLIIDSRVMSTELLLKQIQQLENPPKAYISSAAIGYYGDRDDEMLSESAQPGTEGFLAESTLKWEAAIEKVRQSGIRTVALRIGLVLSTLGGALPKLALPTQFFLGPYFGNGKQWYSWIHIDDICRMFIHAMEQDALEGFYNGVAPNPERNKTFTELIGKAKGRSLLMVPGPEFVLRLVLGEMADTVFGSARVSSEKIEATGFTFLYPELVAALKDLFQRKV